MATFSQAFNEVAKSPPGAVTYTLTIGGRGTYRIEKRSDTSPTAVFLDNYPAPCTQMPIDAGLSDAWQGKRTPMTIVDAAKAIDGGGVIRRRAWCRTRASLSLRGGSDVEYAPVDGNLDVIPSGSFTALDLIADDWYVVEG